MKKQKKLDSIPDDISAMSFEEAYAELKAATERLEAEEIDLETTIREYARASALTKHCAMLLDKAEEQVRVLTESEGVIHLESLDPEEVE
ncbi:MAG TPA: exodeoxyribonuclease VII small subunit [Firmicutes bacterium]|nr:exodeoxyribonuclease VII small subunit [Bacillota bacterium]